MKAARRAKTQRLSVFQFSFGMQLMLCSAPPFQVIVYAVFDVCVVLGTAIFAIRTIHTVRASNVIQQL